MVPNLSSLWGEFFSVVLSGSNQTFYPTMRCATEFWIYLNVKFFTLFISLLSCLTLFSINKGHKYLIENDLGVFTSFSVAI